MVTTVSYDLECEVRTDHVFARLRAIELTPPVLVEGLREIRNALIDARQAHLLLELEIAHALHDDQELPLVESFSGMLSGMRVALVNRDPKHHEHLRFGVHLSREAGQEYGYFTSAADALEWLRNP